jgi:DNA-binding transcriptional LysR family regulator
MAGTIRLDDMRLFSKVAELGSFTAAARALGVPKQTLSHRIAELERALGVQLLHRSTRRVYATEVGAAYAVRCSEILRSADEVNRGLSDADDDPSGKLRITADPTFGEAFLTDLVLEFARRWPAIEVDVVLTRRRVDLVEEGFDIAFRIGHVDDASLAGLHLGPARVRYCASPSYLDHHGIPASPADLARHQCVLVVTDATPTRWPFRGRDGAAMVPVAGRLSFSSFAMARAAALAGFGIAIFPEFSCAQDIRHGRLVPVLDDWRVDVGAVWMLHPARRFVPARIRMFTELVREQFSGIPWLARQPEAP